MPDNESRIDRLEDNLNKLVNVVTGLAGIVKELALDQKAWKQESEERFRRIETAQAEGTEKLNALIHIVDEWIRNRPNQPGA
jgi:hypothetical protein